MQPVLVRHLPSTTLVWLASDTPALPSTPEEPTDDPYRRDVPVPDLMLEVQLVGKRDGTANSVRAPGLALSEIKNPGAE
jgi:hypothetical protein